MSTSVSVNNEPHGQFYFTLQEMGYIAGLVAQRPYAEVEQFMAKIKQQYAGQEEAMRKAASSPPPPVTPATPEPYKPYVDRAPAPIEDPAPTTTNIETVEEKSANA